MRSWRLYVSKCGEALQEDVQLFPLGTSTGATNRVCALGIESSPDMVIVSPSPWKRMFFTSYALRAGGDGGINTGEVLAASLENEPFLLVLCLFDEGPILLASFSHFCCHSWNLAIRLATISFLASSIIGGTTGSMVSHHSVYSAPNILSGSVMVSWTRG